MSKTATPKAAEKARDAVLRQLRPLLVQEKITILAEACQSTGCNEAAVVLYVELAEMLKGA